MFMCLYAKRERENERQRENERKRVKKKERKMNEKMNIIVWPDTRKIQIKIFLFLHFFSC